MIETINVVLIIFMLICAVAATRVRELVSSVFLLGAFSFFLAILWALLAAPDVSFTEAMVGSGASTIFFLLALFGSTHYAKPRPSRPYQGIALIVMILLGSLFFWGSLDLPSLGDVSSSASQYLSPFYLKNAYHDSHTPNVVTAVVVDYRSFDTLIEAAVIFTAGVACLLIFRDEKI